ncbi:carbohydrate ABC transporter permease [Paenibacillus sp. PL2-23]|uniref:carbohydrate ABC transporter permease n=1 Tax=Paenibacillus sp. PL2-23 TaxID=2100729 RepID=UPI0030F5AC5A
MSTYRAKKSESWLDYIIYTALTISSLVVLIPLLYIVTTSFASEKEYLTRGFFIFPKQWTLDGYFYLLTNPGFITALKNAVVISLVGTFINIALTSLLAYGLSKSWIKGRGTMNFMVLFTMLFSGGMIPTYLVVKELGLVGSYWALWLVMAIAPFHLIVMRGFFGSIPIELEEAGRIDGCSEWRIFSSIYLPLSKAAIATFTLFYFVANWNMYFAAILYLNDNNKWPLQVFLRQMLIQEDSSTGAALHSAFEYTPAAKMAAILIAAFPLLVVYPFLQKYFNQGMLLGSVKG